MEKQIDNCSALEVAETFLSSFHQEAGSPSLPPESRLTPWLN